MTTDLRAAEIDDIPQLLDLLKGFHHKANLARWATWEDSRDYWGQYLAGIIQNPYAMCFIVTEQAAPVGVITAVAHQAYWNPTVVIASEQIMWVHPEHRGKKFGRLLIQSLKLWAKGLGVKTVSAGGSHSLGVRPVKKLLLSEGFRVEETILIAEVE